MKKAGTVMRVGRLLEIIEEFKSRGGLKDSDLVLVYSNRDDFAEAEISLALVHNDRGQPALLLAPGVVMARKLHEGDGVIGTCPPSPKPPDA